MRNEDRADPIEAFPLTWPDAQQRTPPGRRREAAFKTGLGTARDELLRELRLLGAREIIVSTMIGLRRDGMFRADEVEPSDPGVACYFKRAGHDYVIACDAYRKVRWNVRAVGLTVEAMRTIQRHGSSQMLEQAFTGFMALPAHAAEPSWWETLGVPSTITGDAAAELKAARDAKAWEVHPDRGGSDDAMARVNRAYDNARRDLGIV